MSPILRILGIVAVFCVAVMAWMILGGLMLKRTSDQSGKLRGDVAELWGNSQTQQAPGLRFQWQTSREVVRTEQEDGRVRTIHETVWDTQEKEQSPSSTAITADLKLDQRLKGLMWYSLYNLTFDGTWTYTHREAEAGTLWLSFAFPDAQGLYDNFRFVINGVDRARELRAVDGRVSTSLPVQPGDKVTLQVGYVTRGMDEWRYAPATGVGNIEDFRLSLTTDFADIDFPTRTMSPVTKERSGSGWKLDWTFKQLVTGQQIGMVTPTQLQPGELASSLSFSAPISLLFFFLVIFVLATLRRIEIHPINYFFLAGAFFAFHLLFSYSVDHLRIVPAFAISSVVSILLVVTYLRLVVSARFAFVEAAAAQAVYLVGFSLAHFWEGFTGLTVTVLSILTLFLLMQMTGRIRWSEVFSKKA